jgi:hypothetical protein
MGMNLIKYPWMQQPPAGTPIDLGKVRPVFVVNAADGTGCAITGGVLSNIGNFPAAVPSPEGMAFPPATSVQQYISITPRIADNTITDATLIVVQRLPTTGANFGWHNIQTDATNSHFCFGSNIYLSTFSSSRWLNGVAVPSGYDKPHVMTVRAKAGKRQAWFNGVSLAAEASSDANVRWNYWSVGSEKSDFMPGVATYAMLILPYAISDKEIPRAPADVWTLFQP